MLQVGEWYYDIVNPSTTDCNVRITVEGDTSSTTAADQPVQINVLTSKSKLALSVCMSYQRYYLIYIKT